MGLGVQRSAAHVAHLLCFDVLHQFAGNVARAVVAEQSGFVQTLALSQPEALRARSSDVGEVLGPHVGAMLPGDGVAREVIEHSRQVHAASPDDLEVSKIGLPHLFQKTSLLN